MGFERTLTNDRGYWLVSVDANGAEREDAGARTSDRIAATIDAERPTDVFVLSHGWKGDVPGAREQYVRWLNGILARAPDGRRPLLVGLHWPSLSFGDESLGKTFSPAPLPGGGYDLDATADEWMALTGAPEAARADVRAILASAEASTDPEELPADVEAAFARLERALSIEPEGPSAPPGQDRERLSPGQVYASLREDGSYGLFDGGGGPIVGLLRQFSFWKMKKRAHEVGRTGGAALLLAVGEAAARVGARVHLFGHSFGCIVVSSMLLHAPRARMPAARSVVLVQGAMSTWAFCAKHPFLDGSGHFAPLLAEERIAGPLVTTKSMFDRAVRALYPMATHLSGLASYGTGSADGPSPPPAEVPKYGGLGTYGALGSGAVELAALAPLGTPHGLAIGRLYNVDAANVIRGGGGFAGAHSDLDHPELYQLVWEAASA